MTLVTVAVGMYLLSLVVQIQLMGLISTHTVKNAV